MLKGKWEARPTDDSLYVYTAHDLFQVRPYSSRMRSESFPCWRVVQARRVCKRLDAGTVDLQDRVGAQ